MRTQTLKLELHCHTVYSKDGLMDFPSLLRAVRKVGLDGVAITDHDTIEGAKAFHAWARARGEDLQVIIGEERTLSDGSHFIGLFLREAIASDSLAEAIQEIEAQGGLCLVPHPFRPKDGLLRNGLEPLAALGGRNAGFELYNAKCSAAVNRRARELLSRGLGPFAGSDAHYDSDLGESMNVVQWQGDLQASLRAMLEGRSPFQLLGKKQAESAGERAYAPVYYRYRKLVKVPKPLLPLAKGCYRAYRNWRYGVGLKPLIEVYAHP